jgi:hypothetical protein
MNSNFPTRSDDPGRPASVLNVLAGIWLIISAWVLGFAAMSVPLWDVLLVGIAVLILAAIRLATPGATGLSWIVFLLGVWLIISPWVLGFGAISVPMGNAVILGILVAIFGLWAAFAPQAPGPSSVRSVR